MKIIKLHQSANSIGNMYRLKTVKRKKILSNISSDKVNIQKKITQQYQYAAKILHLVEVS